MTERSANWKMGKSVWSYQGRPAAVRGCWRQRGWSSSVPPRAKCWLSRLKTASHFGRHVFPAKFGRTGGWPRRCCCARAVTIGSSCLMPDGGRKWAYQRRRPLSLRNTAPPVLPIALSSSVFPVANWLRWSAEWSASLGGGRCFAQGGDRTGSRGRHRFNSGNRWLAGSVL
jgi:hypothetical protein